MIKLIKHLLCRHDYQITRWAYSHGVNGNDPAHIVVEHVCPKCGKTIYSFPAPGSNGEEFILSLADLHCDLPW